MPEMSSKRTDPERVAGSGSSERALPLGAKLDWQTAKTPERRELRGSHVLLRPIDADSDAASLFSVSHPPAGDPAIWTYLPDGPYESPEDLHRMLRWAETAEDAVYFAVVPLPGEQPLGIAAYLRIAPQTGAIEIGHIWFGVSLQRTTAATEATISAIAAWSGSAMRSTPLHGVQLSALASSSRASFVSTWWSRAATATRLGMRSPIGSGRRSGAGSRDGSRRGTGMEKDGR
jgi:hypothetical protein